MIHLASRDKKIYNQVKDKRNHPIGLQVDGIEKSEKKLQKQAEESPKKIEQTKVRPAPILSLIAQGLNCDSSYVKLKIALPLCQWKHKQQQQNER